MADVTSALQEATEKMNKAVEVAKDDFGSIRTGRAHPAMFNKIMVDCYGTFTALSQLATIQVPESRMAVISPFDKGAMASIEKAIRESDLGLNPSTEGNLIRVPIPDLSEERRKDIVKVAGRYAEACRVAIRNIRRDGIETARKAEKEGLISEDDRHTQENMVQKLTDEFVKKVDDALSHKEKEITQV